ncbi:hypothetical protein GGF39_002601 [Coemansia sp. RSA 1721]|nr:hypothetical protein GGF39_002601 [Coemansia sp. RSA 1721]
MARVSAEQVLNSLKKNGTYDAMRQELQSAFVGSERGRDFEAKIKEIMRNVSEGRVYFRSTDKKQLLESRIAEQLAQTGLLERMGTDARNFWLVAERQITLKQRIAQAIGEATQSSEHVEDVATRPLEIDPPRIPSQGSNQPPRTHSFYRRGDSVAAFVALSDPLCTGETQYMCIMAEIIACDSERNAYTISDLDAREGIQGTWVAHWDQLITIKRPYEYVYKLGEQVYALYRDDSSTHTQVTTEFFPGRVEHIGPVSLAIRFDTGELGHVYYDEAFAAGRIGFLRRYSEERRRTDAHDAMVEFQGKIIPSFTGFWPSVARPALGKHDRKVRYRQMPPLLCASEPPVKAGSARQSSPSSDMDIAGSSSGAPSPLPASNGPEKPPQPPSLFTPPPLPKQHAHPPSPPLPLKPVDVNGQALPKPVASSDEEGEIDNAEDAVGHLSGLGLGLGPARVLALTAHLDGTVEDRHAGKEKVLLGVVTGVEPTCRDILTIMTRIFRGNLIVGAHRLVGDTRGILASVVVENLALDHGRVLGPDPGLGLVPGRVPRFRIHAIVDLDMVMNLCQCRSNRIRNRIRIL